MTLPAGVTQGPGRRLAVSQKGYFTRFPDGSVHHTACRFASLAQDLERGGYRLPLARTAPAAGQPDNFVHTLQRAGDNTPKTGSTMRQAQKALRVVFGTDAPAVLFGTMTDDEFVTALRNGASIGIGFDCSKLPPRQKRWVGQKYQGGHYLTFDDVRIVAGDAIEVAVTDPMFSPAKNIHSSWQPWADFTAAASRLNGELRVTVMYQPAPAPPTEPTCEETVARLTDELAAAHQQIDTLTEQLEHANGRADGLAAELDGATQRIADKDAKAQELLLL